MAVQTLRVITAAGTGVSADPTMAEEIAPKQSTESDPCRRSKPNILAEVPIVLPHTGGIPEDAGRE